MGYIKEQIDVIKRCDPAIKSTLEVLLYPSFKAMIYYKISHYFYAKKRYFIARYLSEKAKEKQELKYTLVPELERTYLLITELV